MAKSNGVKAKKHLGQHFLKDENICQKIVDALQANDAYKQVLEVGPGIGAITKYLLQKDCYHTYVAEIDNESIAFLSENFPDLAERIINFDFLKLDFSQQFNGQQVGIIGNFPYNISSQILFKIYDNVELVPEMVGMFQKEVAERVCQKPGTKTYGILSVLLQAYFNVEYLFTVSEKVFIPPPKVKSGVIRLTRKPDFELPCNPKLFKQVVKATFNHRRKTIRNTLKPFMTEGHDREFEMLNLRPEKLSFTDFFTLTNWLEHKV